MRGGGKSVAEAEAREKVRILLGKGSALVQRPSLERVTAHLAPHPPP